MSDNEGPKRADNGTILSSLPPLEMFPKGFSEVGYRGCSYTNKTSPLYVKHMADDIWNLIQTLGKPQAVVGSWHVRRGDAITLCNTTLGRMESYLLCSFNGTSSKPITLLFASDERNSEYRLGIQRLVEDLGHVTFVDLDEMVLKYIKGATRENERDESKSDNYHVFLLEKNLRTRAAFKLAHRRTISCKDCHDFVGHRDLWK
jgi:hypothetical protein